MSSDGRIRCGWGDWNDALYLVYHDEEWGVPSHDRRHLFEMLVLEGAQAGLSWTTILRKRDGYRAAFEGFEPERVAAFGPDDVDRLLLDPGIVRNRAKIESAIDNARAALALEAAGTTLVDHLWSFVGGHALQNDLAQTGELPAETAESTAMSKDLKRRGFRFVGPTTCYAFMQATGLVNDHTLECFRRAEVAALA
jgi:DNA-3-methyladenine glycosylase I